MTGKMEGIMKRCDQRMLRYMAGVKWQDMISNEELCKIFGGPFKNETEKIAMV
jgi:hypothetical protein